MFKRKNKGPTREEFFDALQLLLSVDVRERPDLKFGHGFFIAYAFDSNNKKINVQCTHALCDAIANTLRKVGH